MEQGFIDKLKIVISKHGQDVLLDKEKCQNFLSDYTQIEYPKETRRIIKAAALGISAEIASAEDNLEACKKKSIKTLEEDHFMANDIASDIVNTLALVLKGDTAKTEFADDLLTQANSCNERREFDKAFELYKKAAEAGNVYAMYMLSRYYSRLSGNIPFNKELRDEWFKKAVEGGCGEALYDVATDEYDNPNKRQDPKLAFEYYLKAAEAGYWIACEKVGWCYNRGYLVGEDLEKSKYWYDKAKEIKRNLYDDYEEYEEYEDEEEDYEYYENED